MALLRTCRNPKCRTVSSKLTKCPKCKTPYGPIAFGLDYSAAVPSALTEREKREMQDLLRKPAGGTHD